MTRVEQHTDPSDRVGSQSRRASAFLRAALKRVRQLPWRYLPSRAIEVRIAGELYVVDSRSALPPSLNDYDYGWLRALASGKRCVLDVGANIGVTALVFTRHMLPEGRCVLFDSAADVLLLARRNLARAGQLTRTILVRAMVGDLTTGSPDVATFDTNDPDAESFHQLKRDLASAPTITLDDFCASRGLTPDLIKIDVEGAEHAVLRGCAELVNHARPLVQVELHAFAPVTMHEAASSLLHWCEEARYAGWYLARHERLTSPDRIAHRGRCHVLLVPADMSYPEVLRTIAQGG